MDLLSSKKREDRILSAIARAVKRMIEFKLLCMKFN